MLHPPHYDPLQPRVPKGHEGGGEWTREGDHTVRTAFLGPFTPAASVAATVVPGGAAIALTAAAVAAAGSFVWLSIYNDRSHRAVIEFRAREYRKTRDKELDVANVALVDADRVAQACRMFGTVQSLTTIAADTVRPMRKDWPPAEFGTAVHSLVQEWVNGPDREKVRDKNFRAEVSYEKMRAEGVYGRKGSIRVDVLERVDDDTVCVYDIKTGRRVFGPKRMKEIAQTVFAAYPNAKRFLVIEIRPGIDLHPASRIYVPKPDGRGWMISP